MEEKKFTATGAHRLKMTLKCEKNICGGCGIRPPTPSSSREDKVEELQPSRPPNKMLMRAHFLDHNPRRFSRLSTKSATFRQCIFGVRASWSLPLKLEIPTGLISHIKSKKLAPLLLFLSHETCQIFLSRILKSKQNGEQDFLGFEPSSRPNFRLFYNV